MNARCFCLILFVLATPLDDALARATPEPGDDAWAAQNNDYLPATSGEAIAPQLHLTPAPAWGDAPAPVPVSLRHPPARNRRPAHRGPDILSLFMSFQC